MAMLVLFESSLPVVHFRATQKENGCLHCTVQWGSRHVRTGHWLAKQVHSVKRSPMFVRCTCFLYFRRSSSNRTWSLKRHLLCVLCALMISYGFASRCTLILSSFSQFLSSVCHLPWMTGHLRKLLPLNLALRVRHTTVYFELADKAKREFGKSV